MIFQPLFFLICFISLIMSIPILPAFLLAISIVFGAYKTPWIESLLAQLLTPWPSALNSLNHWLLIQQRINFKLATLIYRSLHTLALNTCHLYYILIYAIASGSLSSPNNLVSPSRGFRYAGPSLWNSLPHHLRSTDSYTVFKSNLKLTFSPWVDFWVFRTLVFMVFLKT